VLDAECVADDNTWDGNLLHFSMRSSNDPGDLAAMVVSQHGHGCGWLNLRLVELADRPWVWLKLRAAAEMGPCTILFASDLPQPVLLSDEPGDAGC
jgi:hypothetical protein